MAASAHQPSIEASMIQTDNVAFLQDALLARDAMNDFIIDRDARVMLIRHIAE